MRYLILHLLLVPALVGAANVPPPPDLPEFAVFGVDRVELGREARVDPGAVGVNLGTVSLAVEARVAGAIAANTIKLARDAQARRYFCQIITRRPGGKIAGGPVVGGSTIPSCIAFTAPLVASLQPVVAGVVTQATDLRVPPRSGTAPVAAGTYGDIRVGRGALLQLGGGDYAFRSLRIGRLARVVCVDECHLRVLRRVRLARGAELGAASTIRADQARVDIEGQGSATTFKAAREATVAATIYSPAGRVVLGRAGTYRGAYIGRVVLVGAESRVRGDSALP